MVMKKMIFTICAVIMTMTFLYVGCGGTETVTVTKGDESPYDTFTERLLDYGASVQHMGSINQPFLSGQGRIVRVNGEDLQVFEYANRGLAEDDIRDVRPDGCCFGTTIISWMGSPHLYQKDRLIVIYIGDNSSMRNLLENILGSQFAGATYGAYALNGERIYFTAESASGKPITRTGGLFFMHRIACVTCHGEDGEGGRIVMMMWDIDVPDITWEHLTEEEHGDEHEEHPPYTEESLREAIIDGIEPNGEEMDEFMPRWDMADEDLDDLIEFLKTL
jgi:mono/diheme cytochrome c family protein